eukprot:scaffold6944_cov35-Phaeocystis_antarctica.AAC.4
MWHAMWRASPSAAASTSTGSKWLESSAWLGAQQRAHTSLELARLGHLPARGGSIVRSTLLSKSPGFGLGLL